MPENNPVICAIDTSDIAEARSIVSEISASVGMVKLGLEFYTSCGTEGVKEIVRMGTPVFLDLKFHDIPNTVKNSVRAASSLGVDMLTVHACGGTAMLKSAVKEAKKCNGKKPLILAVTVLTSLDESDLNSMGVDCNDVSDQVLRLADLAVKAGVDGLVCSANELEKLRRVYNNDIVLVVPGIRPSGGDKGDQKRVMSPKAAIERGADYLVIGRPITEAGNKKLAVEEIIRDVRN